MVMKGKEWAKQEGGMPKMAKEDKEVKEQVKVNPVPQAKPKQQEQLLRPIGLTGKLKVVNN